MRKKNNIRYKNSREKPLNQEIQSFSSKNQSGYKKEDFQNQNVLVKDDMSAEVKASSSKKAFINHSDGGDKYKDLNKGGDSYEIAGKENINQNKSFLEPKKDKKVRQKQIGRFYNKEKEAYNNLSKDADKNVTPNQHDRGFRDDKTLQKVSAKEQRHKENARVIHTDKPKNVLRANRKRYKKILQENRPKEDLNLKYNQRKYFKSNSEDEGFTRIKDKNEKNPLNTKEAVKEKEGNKGEAADKQIFESKDRSKKSGNKFKSRKKRFQSFNIKSKVWKRSLKVVIRTAYLPRV